MLKHSEVNADTQVYIQQIASHLTCQYKRTRLILDFKLSCHVVNVVRFLLGNPLVSEFYMPTFRNNLSVPSSKAPTTQKKAYNIVSLHTKPE